MKKILLLKLLAAIFLVQPVFPVRLKAQTNDDRAFGNKSVEGKRVALVIGNAEYDSGIGKLKNPVNDAGDIADALKRLGFSLVGGKAQLNLSRRRMLEQIREFGSQIRQGGVGVFYFAGHGVQVDRRNYLIPITDSLKYQEDAEYEAVDVDSILREMEYAENALNILILDACRNNALPGKTRNADKGLTRPREPSGVYIAFAARDGQTASENSSGRNGLYTQELLKNLETPNLRLEDIFINTRREVKRLSNRLQEPVEYGSLNGEFYLNANKIHYQASETFLNGEELFWQETEKSNSIFSYEKYLNEYPNGEFSRVAKIRLGKLKWEFIKPIARRFMNYSWIFPYSDNLFSARKNGKEGFLNSYGIEQIPLKYDDARAFSEDLSAISVNDKWGYIDSKGKEIVPLIYDMAFPFSEGQAAVKLNGRMGFIDKTGKAIVPIDLDYDYVDEFIDGVAIGCKNHKCSYIDKSGKPTSKTRHKFSEGLEKVYDASGKCGYGNKMETIIPIKFDYCDDFSEGLAIVRLNENWGAVDKTGKEVIPITLNYEWVSSFEDGLSSVHFNKSRGLIDRTGKEIVSPKVYFIWCLGLRKEGFIGVYRNSKKGFVDIYGNEYFDL